MDFAKRLNFDNLFIFLFLVVFPFGQIIRLGILQPIDIVVGLGAFWAIFKKYKKPEVFKYFENFLFIACFSWIFGLLMFRQIEVFYGLLYLVRLAAYFYFFVYVWNFAKKNANAKKLLIDSLLAVSVASAIFGWIQYFIFPSIKPFFVWGWDEHLFRLVGTFLDPTFLGLIIVFGSIIAIYKKKWFLTLFLIVSLAFTYSRASYLAFFAGLTGMAYFQKNFRKLFLFFFGFLFLMFLLPTSRNTVLSFTRTFSAIARIENYAETLKIFKGSPVFGVGFNNICLVRSDSLGYNNFQSHACSGSDSSLLLVLATTGIAGFIILAFSTRGIAFNLKRDSRFQILASCFTALLVHSLFSNSLFYPWIMGYFFILLAISLGSEV